MLNQVREMMLYAGEPKYLLYGTDLPIATMESYLRFMRTLDLAPEERELVMWRNAARLFKIDVEKLKRQAGSVARAAHGLDLAG